MSVDRGYNAFCQYITGKSVSLIGLGVSNLPLIGFLLDCGANLVLVRDLKKKETDPEVQVAKTCGANVLLGDEYLSALEEDIIIRSPGIRPDLPSFCEAERKGSRITCETELFLQFVPCKSFAVTGSDGKTTTTTLIAKILEKEGYNVHLGGNIGKSMLPQLKDIFSEKDVSVSELSSFQLMNCKFSPDVCVITNLAENHLDWHIDMAEYLDAKKNILRHQTIDSVAVLNFDNPHTKICEALGDKIYFTYDKSRLAELKEEQNVVYFDGKTIICRIDGQETEILKADDILLPGKHNIENYMAAIGATARFCKREAVVSIAKSFGGVEHRIELVRELDKVKYYNSSIDSSPSRSTAALRSFKDKVIMIAGGYDKNLDYTALGNEICEHVKTLLLCGATAEKIESATKRSSHYINNNPVIIRCDSLKDCVWKAKEMAAEGDIVILSPASASFDQFKNFEERGKYFKDLVKDLI